MSKIQQFKKNPNKCALKARKQLLKIESSVLPFPLRAEFQEEISQICVAFLWADKVIKAPPLQPGYFLLSKERERRNFSNQAILCHGTSVLWCSPFVFSFALENVHTGKIIRQICEPSALSI